MTRALKALRLAYPSCPSVAWQMRNPMKTFVQIVIMHLLHVLAACKLLNALIPVLRTLQSSRQNAQKGHAARCMLTAAVSPNLWTLERQKSYSTSLRVLLFLLLLSCLWAASLYARTLEITFGVVEIRLHNDPSWPWTCNLPACCVTGLDNHAWLQRLQVAPHTLRHRLCAGLTATDGADSVEEKYDFEKNDFVRRTLDLPKGHR